MRLLRIFLFCGCCAASPALAQTAPGAEPGVTREDCQAAPSTTEDAQPQPPTGGDLSAKLDACNGVLQPPSTGDTEIREPAPDGGETPVIPPGALPEQPPATAG